jgi:hypothetical protein
MKLEALSHPNDDPALVRSACFYVGWYLRSPDSWEYFNIWTQETDTVTISELIKAVRIKYEAIQASKNNQTGARDTTNIKSISPQIKDGLAAKRKSK